MKDLILAYLENNGFNIPENFEDLEVDQLENQFDISYDQIDECYIDSVNIVYCDREGILTNENNVFYCDYSNTYFTKNNYIQVEVYRNRRTKYISNYFDSDYSQFDIVIIHNGDLYELDCTCFVESEGDYYPEDECYYWESDGEHHLEPEPDEDETGDYNFSYHRSNPANFSEWEKPKIGFEVEKEDETIKEKYRAQKLQDLTGWGKESDGSLNSDSGFELVSPIFPLHETRDYFVQKFAEVKELLDADYSNTRCGGHINYSNPMFSQSDLLNAVKGYLPLLYALYPHRVNQSYCKAKTPQELLKYPEKYSSVFIKDRCIEFRIFGAVKSAKNLLWRLELIQIIDLYKTEKPSQVLLNMSDESHPLYLHLTKIYNHEKLMILINRFEKYSKEFHNVYLDNRLLNEIDNRLTLKIITQKQNLY